MLKENSVDRPEFTYDSYHQLLELLTESGYKFIKYGDIDNDYTVILRHDIDTSISKAVKLAELEHKWGGIQSTYFVLLTSNFYNVASRESIEGLKQILTLGHEIGLHFDEMSYPEMAGNPEEIKNCIIREANILGEILQHPIKVVSYHRPTKNILNAQLEIPGLINSYGYKYFQEYKYLSDSRHRWREPVLDIIRTKEYKKLHILTHAFWYNKNAKTISESVQEFVNAGNIYRWESMNENMSEFESIMPKENVR